jgi:hypothetical protein
MIERGFFEGGGKSFQRGELLLSRKGGFASGLDFASANDTCSRNRVFGWITKWDNDDVMAMS